MRADRDDIRRCLIESHHAVCAYSTAVWLSKPDEEVEHARAIEQEALRQLKVEIEKILD